MNKFSHPSFVTIKSIRIVAHGLRVRLSYHIFRDYWLDLFGMSNSV